MDHEKHETKSPNHPNCGSTEGCREARKNTEPNIPATEIPLSPFKKGRTDNKYKQETATFFEPCLPKLNRPHGGVGRCVIGGLLGRVCAEGACGTRGGEGITRAGKGGFARLAPKQIESITQ